MEINRSVTDYESPLSCCIWALHIQSITLTSYGCYFLFDIKCVSENIAEIETKKTLCICYLCFSPETLKYTLLEYLQSRLINLMIKI